MGHFLNSIRIAIKLPLVMMLLTFLGIVGAGGVAIVNADRTIKGEDHLRLLGVSELQAGAVKALFEAIDRDIHTVSVATGTATAITEFTDAYQVTEAPEQTLQRIYIEENPHPTGEKDKMITTAGFTPYGVAHGRHHPYFRALLQQMQYYDVFLFDTDGNLVYTVFKERDFATNVLTGAWKDTGLAEVYRRAMQLDADAASAFVDFAPYAPSFGAPASFIARPVFNVSGTRVGVIAYQMPIDAINTTVGDMPGRGETGDAFLVGDDYLMRTDSVRTTEDDILQTRVENVAIDSGLAGGAVIEDVANELGEMALWSVQPIEFLGTTWALAAKQDYAELHAPIAAMQRKTALIGAALMLAALILSVLASRSISRPVSAVNVAMKQVSEGQYDIDIRAVKRGDEVGDMARTLETFRQSLQDGAAQARENRFRGIALENSNAAVMMTGTDQVVTWVNESMSGILGVYGGEFKSASRSFDPEAIVGSALEVFLSNDVARDVRDAIVDPAKLPYKTQLAVGSARFNLVVNYVPDGDGQPMGYIVEWADVTEMFMKNAIVDSIKANQVMAEFAMSGELTASNALFCAMVDQDADQVLGRRAEKVFRFDEAAARQRGKVFDRLNNGENVFGRFRLPRKDGTEAVVDGGFTPIIDVRGQSLKIVLIGNDVTDVRREIEAAEAQQAEMVAAQKRVVETLRNALGQLRDGDLTTRIEEAFTDDYEQLRQDFNAAVDHLLNAMHGVIENSEQIRGEALEISNAADDLSSRTERQAATLEETAAALDQLTSSVKSAADGAAHANNLVESARDNAEVSGEVVREAIEAMGEIATSSQQISKITDVIDDIAFQTNLLALNAGVEAARAGDAGRGFAVVASEVRALAQRSSDAAREINDLISASGGQVKRGVELVNQAGAALKGITAGVTEISENVSGIAIASREQSSGLAEINKAMNQLDQVTQQNAAMFEETTAASHGLTRGAEELTRTTAQFHTGDATAKSAQIVSPGFGSQSQSAKVAADRPPALVKPANADRQTAAVPAPDADWDAF